MSQFHPNSNKHKREHRGYNSRPTKKEVNALMDFYSIMAAPIEPKTTVVKQQDGAQLKLF